MSKRKTFAAPSLFAMPAQSEPSAQQAPAHTTVKQMCRFEHIKDDRKGCSIAVRCTHAPVGGGYCSEHQYIVKLLKKGEQAGYPAILEPGVLSIDEGRIEWQERLKRFTVKRAELLEFLLKKVA